MKGNALISILALGASIALICSSCETSRPPDQVEQAIVQPLQHQVLTAQEPTQVISANLSHHDLQLIATDQVQHAQFASQSDQVPHAQFASQAAEPCDTCGNSIWGVFKQHALLMAFLALLSLSAVFYWRHQRHRRTVTSH